MPIYEYKCSKCGKYLEVMQKISDPPLSKCPECSGKLKKLVSNTSFVLKGSGWYADGYSSPSNRKEDGKSKDLGKDKSKTDNKDMGVTKTEGSVKKPSKEKSSKEKAAVQKTSGEKTAKAAS